MRIHAITAPCTIAEDDEPDGSGVVITTEQLAAITALQTTARACAELAISIVDEQTAGFTRSVAISIVQKLTHALRRLGEA